MFTLNTHDTVSLKIKQNKLNG